MSFHYWQNQGQPRKRVFVTLGNSYHGETLGALAVGNVDLYKSTYAPLLMDVLTVPSPDCYGREPGESWAEHTRRKFALMQTALERYAEDIAAVIIEPLVQCAGGMRMYDPVYLSMLRAACDRYGVHLIADEIAVGFGRTGTMFACEQARITPGFPVPVEGPDRRLPAAVGGADQGVDLRGVLRRIHRTARVSAFAQLHRQCAGLRRGARHARHLFQRAGARDQ